jgi:hypothetical protein
MFYIRKHGMRRQELHKSPHQPTTYVQHINFVPPICKQITPINSMRFSIIFLICICCILTAMAAKSCPRKCKKKCSRQGMECKVKNQNKAVKRNCRNTKCFESNIYIYPRSAHGSPSTPAETFHMSEGEGVKQFEKF